MHLFAALSLFFQVFFAVHAIRTGRDRYWVYLIIFFPGAGCLIYFISEYLPHLQQSYKVRRLKKDLIHTLNPGGHLRRLQEQVEITPSVKNKKQLAEAYVNLGLFDAAISMYESCREGAYQNDLHLLEGLSLAYFFKGEYATAEIYLEKMLKHKETITPDPFRLLLARCREATGRDKAAEEIYSQIVKTISGEEARCRYALLLKRNGRMAEANKLFDDILQNARMSPKYYRKAQKQWIDTARNERSRGR